MNNTEIQFFEKYKKLDNLCKDIMNSERGVTSYINEMEGTPPEKARMVPTWQDDYRKLKHVRWVRNDIAHGDGASECKRSDVDFVVSFYKRIMNQKDPLGMIQKKKAGRRAPKKKKHSAISFGLVILILVILMLVYILVKCM